MSAMVFSLSGPKKFTVFLEDKRIGNAIENGPGNPTIETMRNFAFRTGSGPRGTF